MFAKPIFVSESGDSNHILSSLSLSELKLKTSQFLGDPCLSLVYSASTCCVSSTEGLSTCIGMFGKPINASESI